jgi:N-acetylmuramoyl-L-alanine amidase
MKLAWSIGHDPVHTGAFSLPLGKTEHSIAREVVEVGENLIKSLELKWEVFNPSDYVRSENKSAGSVLRDKINLINEWGADVAIESHFNSSSNGQARGCETLYFSLPFGKGFSKEGKRLAESIQETTIRIMNQAPSREENLAIRIKDRGAKGMGSITRIYSGPETFPRYAFLIQTKMPAVILEPLFISSHEDVFCLANEHEQEIHRLAMSVVAGLMKWNAGRL